MYVNLRRYPRIGVAREAVERSVEDEFLPELERQPGFRGYLAFWDEEGAGVGVGVFADREAAHASTDAVRRWVVRHPGFFPARGEEFSGECVAHEAPHGGERQAGAGQRPPHVLVRMLEGVPATQDTRAFVRQRTLPMIARSPGFRGVWMARSDADGGRAAVVTLFDGRRQAEACHDAAVALLGEGLPGVAVARVLQGPGVIARIGDR